MDNSNNNTNSTQSGAKWAIPVIGAALALSLGFNAYQANRIQAVDGQVNTVNAQIAELRQGLSKVEAQTGSELSAFRGDINNVKSEAEKIAKDAAKSSSWTAQSLAQRHADKLAAKLEKANQSNEKLVAELNTQLSEVKTSAETQLNTVSTDVKQVRTDVDTTRTELQNTIADLRRATGDMGVMSGLIATNSSELKALRELGERNYYEFRLTRNDKVQKVGDVMLALKKADVKKSRFTLELNADDRKIEKKDKTVNEPVQFYVASKARQPYEIVVNEISKDTIVGYLSTPKVQISRK